MVRALTKKTRHGTLYTRPPRIEQAIAQALTEAPATLRARAAVRERQDPRYLASEVLVHLIRNALRASDALASDTLLSCLTRRCARRLMRLVGPTNAFDAAEVRSQIMDRLYDLFTDELENPADDSLDYWEARFGDAFAKVRAQVIHAAKKHHALFEPLESRPGADDDDAPDTPELADPSHESDPFRQAELAQLLRAFQSMPFELQQAAFWKWQGYKTESNDQTETTVATLCGVSGREIRNRLAEIKARLKRMEEES
jgi:hypothetical protein